MQRAQRFGEQQPDANTFIGRQGVPQLRLERFRCVTSDLDLSAADLIIGQFHHVIEEAARHAPADMEDIDEAIVRARDRFEGRHAFEFAIESALALEGVAINHLHRPQCSRQAARQPDFAVGSAPDDAEHLVIGNRRNAHVLALYRFPARQSITGSQST